MKADKLVEKEIIINSMIKEIQHLENMIKEYQSMCKSKDELITFFIHQSNK